MEFEDVVFGRRSVRKYTSEPVGMADMQYVIDAALYAPSGVDLQPWYFVAIRGEEEMTRLTTIMETAVEELTPFFTERFKNNPEVVEETTRYMRTLGNAPACIMVFSNKPSQERTDNNVSQSVGMAVQNLMLAAYDRGLGTCYITSVIRTSQSQALHDIYAAEHGELFGMIAIGHPEASPKAPRRKDGRYVIL